jgi:hypothetical protein
MARIIHDKTAARRGLRSAGALTGAITAACELSDQVDQGAEFSASFRGLHCGLEDNVADVANAKEAVLPYARTSVEQCIAHLAIAVAYPR